MANPDCRYKPSAFTALLDESLSKVRQRAQNRKNDREWRNKSRMRIDAFLDDYCEALDSAFRTGGASLEAEARDYLEVIPLPEFPADQRQDCLQKAETAWLLARDKSWDEVQEYIVATLRSMKKWREFGSGIIMGLVLGLALMKTGFIFSPLEDSTLTWPSVCLIGALGCGISYLIGFKSARNQLDCLNDKVFDKLEATVRQNWEQGVEAFANQVNRSACAMHD